MWLFIFYLLTVAGLRFSLVYLCVQFVFSAAALHCSVVWRRFYSLLAFLLREKPWNLTSFCSSIGKWRPLFLQRWWDPIRLKIIAVVIKGAKVLDICTTLLPDLASDGSPLFAEPMFLFGWALCNASTYCTLAFWLSWVNYALRGEFHYFIDSYKTFLHMHCFGCPELIFPLKTSFRIILFRFLETKIPISIRNARAFNTWAPGSGDWATTPHAIELK